MPHTYVITAISNNGSQLMVGGSVDGIPTSVALGQTSFANVLAFEAAIAPAMLALVTIPSYSSTLPAFQVSFTS